MIEYLYECPGCGCGQNPPGLCEVCASEIQENPKLKEAIKDVMKDLKKAYELITKALDEKDLDFLYDAQVLVLDVKDKLEKVLEGEVLA